MEQKALGIVVRAKDEASKDLRKVQNEVDRMGRSVTSASSDAQRGIDHLNSGFAAFAGIAKQSAVIGVAAAGAFAASSVKMAGDFEQGLNVFKSVSGATADQMSMVAEKARELGKDASLPGVSARNAADAMVVLAKAGLSVNDTLSASKGVLALAKAGQLDVADAADVTAKAMTQFSLKGKDAVMIADLLSAAANASVADVGQMAFALSQGGASAANMGVSINDTITTLGLFANNALIGSDAGTSLKTMMQRLAAPTADAAAKMKEIGLQAFDAKGNFVGMKNLAGQLESSLSKLNVEQRNEALATIFGSDAMRAASVLTKEGAAGFDKMALAVNKQGAATDLAAAQNSGFNGALDNLKSTLETLGTGLGTKVLPYLTDFAKAAADFAGSKEFENTLKSIGKVLLEVGGFFGAWIREFKEGNVVIQGATIFLGSLLVILGLVSAAMVVATAATTAFGVVMAIVASPVFLIVAAIAAIIAIGVLLVKNWDAVKNAIGVAIDWIAEKFNYMKDHFFETIGFMVGFFATLPTKLLLLVGEAILGVVKYLISVKWSDVWNGLWDSAKKIFDKIQNAYVAVWQWLHDLKWSDIFAGIGKGIGNALIGMIEGAVKGALKGLPGNLENKFKIPRFARGVRNFGGGFAMVGERGPEIVGLPKGSNVYTNGESREMMLPSFEDSSMDTNDSGSQNNNISQPVTINITLNGPFVGDESALRRFAVLIQKKVDETMRAQGTTNVNMLRP